MHTKRHKRPYVFRVVSLNLERLCHKSPERKGRSVSESMSATFGAGVQGSALLFPLKEKVFQAFSRFGTNPLSRRVNG